MILDNITDFFPARVQKIVVGVSGGPDSLCLLDGLAACEVPVRVAHFNHNLRPEAKEEAEYVQNIARDRGVPCSVGQGEVRAYAQENALSLEEAARLLRYRFLFQVAENVNADGVAVGHNANDQVETLLMNLIRGTGLEGLTGMEAWWSPNPWHETIPLLRPLLGIWREEILAYCAQRGLEPLYDRSNLDPGFFRNRVRHELLPEMARYWPGLQRRLWQTADILREDQRSLAWFLDEVWNDFLLEAGENYLVFRREAFLEYPVGVQRRLVRRVFARLRPDYREVSFQTVERARECIQEPPPSKEEDLAGELRIRAVGAYVYVCPRGASPPLRYWPQMLDETPRALTRSGTMEFSGPWAIKARVVEDFQGPYRKARRDQDVHQAWFDLKEVDFPLLVRPRKPGERFAPLGMDGHTMKISDFMVNEKVPNHVRDQWPLVLSGGNVLWIPGLRQSHQARIREQTRAALQLVLTGGSIDLA